MKEFKKYIIGFIIGLSLVTGISYAVNTGSIGELFKTSGDSWVLMGDKIEDGTIDSSEIGDETITSSDILDETITGLDIAKGTIQNINLSKSLSGSIYQIGINKTLIENIDFYTKEEVYNKTESDKKNKFGYKSYKLIGDGSASDYKCIKIVLPDECVSSSKDKIGPMCKLSTSEWYNGRDSTPGIGGQYYQAGGYQRYFRIIPWGIDTNHSSGKKWLMTGHTSNGAKWHTWTTSLVDSENRNTGASASGVLGRSERSACSEYTLNKNNLEDKDPREIMLITRNDFSAVFTIEYPILNSDNYYDGVY